MVIITVKEKFNRDVGYAPNPRILVLVVELPNGAIELTTNHECIKEKVEYVRSAYDDSLRLKTNLKISILDWIIV